MRGNFANKLEAQASAYLKVMYSLALRACDSSHYAAIYLMSLYPTSKRLVCFPLPRLHLRITILHVFASSGHQATPMLAPTHADPPSKWISWQIDAIKSSHSLRTSFLFNLSFNKTMNSSPPIRATRPASFILLSIRLATVLITTSPAW